MGNAISTLSFAGAQRCRSAASVRSLQSFLAARVAAGEEGGRRERKNYGKPNRRAASAGLCEREGRESARGFTGERIKRRARESVCNVFK